VKAVALLMKTSFFTIALEEGAVLFLTRFGKHHSYFFFFMQAKGSSSSSSSSDLSVNFEG
jgi:hypothetical protein